MDYKQFIMLRAMHEVIINGQNVSELEAFEILVEWIAVQTSTDPGMTTRFLYEEVNTVLHELFDADILKEEMRDWLGLFHERIAGQKLYTDEADAQQVAKLVSPVDDMKMPRPYFFHRCRTGRHIIEHFRVMGKGAIYYGMEPDPLAYHIALVNAALYDIPAQILNADPMSVRPDLASKNWFMANTWYEPDTQKLQLIV